MFDEEQILSRLSNKDLIHKNRYCKTKAKALIAELKELVVTTDRIKRELQIRVVDLKIETALAEEDRLNSANSPLIDALLDLH